MTVKVISPELNPLARRKLSWAQYFTSIIYHNSTVGIKYLANLKHFRSDLFSTHIHPLSFASLVAAVISHLVLLPEFKNRSNPGQEKLSKFTVELYNQGNTKSISARDREMLIVHNKQIAYYTIYRIKLLLSLCMMHRLHYRKCNITFYPIMFLCMLQY